MKYEGYYQFRIHKIPIGEDYMTVDEVLMKAVKERQNIIVKLCLELLKINNTRRLINNSTPVNGLRLAAEDNNFEIMRLFHGFVDKIDVERLALDAAKDGQLEVIEYLHDHWPIENFVEIIYKAMEYDDRSHHGYVWI